MPKIASPAVSRKFSSKIWCGSLRIYLDWLLHTSHNSSLKAPPGWMMLSYALLKIKWWIFKKSDFKLWSGMLSAINLQAQFLQEITPPGQAVQSCHSKPCWKRCIPAAVIILLAPHLQLMEFFNEHFIPFSPVVLIISAPGGHVRNGVICIPELLCRHSKPILDGRMAGHLRTNKGAQK